MVVVVVVVDVVGTRTGQTKPAISVNPVDAVICSKFEANLPQAEKWLNELSVFLNSKGLACSDLYFDKDEEDSYGRAHRAISVPTADCSCEDAYIVAIEDFIVSRRAARGMSWNEIMWHSDPFGYANTLFLANDDNPGICCEWNEGFWILLEDLQTPNDVLGAIERAAGKNETAYGPNFAGSLVCLIGELVGCNLSSLPGRIDWTPILKKHREFYKGYWKTNNERINLSPRLRHQVLERDGFRCCDCGASPQENGVSLEVDHRIALANGGTNDIDNLRALCRACNAGKGARSIDYPVGHQ